MENKTITSISSNGAKREGEKPTMRENHFLVKVMAESCRGRERVWSTHLEEHIARGSTIRGEHGIICVVYIVFRSRLILRGVNYIIVNIDQQVTFAI